MGFSYDAKMIVTLTGAPDYTAYLWIWDKAKIITSVKCLINIPVPVKVKKEQMILNQHSSQVTNSLEPNRKLSSTNTQSMSNTLLKANISSTQSININGQTDNKNQLTSKNLDEKSRSNANQSILNIQIREVSVNPIDQFQILVLGNQVFRLYKYLEGSLKQVPLPKIENRVNIHFY